MEVDVSVEKFQDQMCIAQYCSTQVPFYIMAESSNRNNSALDGVIGLSQSENTFPYQFISNNNWEDPNSTDELIPGLNRTFSLSYTKNPAEPSIFTLGWADPNFYASEDDWVYAKAAVYTPQPNWWAVEVNKVTYGTIDIPDLEGVVLIEDTAWAFDLAYPVFNQITNYIIYTHPCFTRDDDLVLSAPGECPTDFENLEFHVTASEAGSHDIIFTVLPEDYLHYDEDGDKRCHVLFTPADGKTTFGVSVLEKYVTVFEHGATRADNRIGFNPRHWHG